MSIRLKSRTESPPNGFRFEQPETGWKSWITNPTTLWDFRLLCNELQKHRQANPRFKLPSDMAVIIEEVDHANALRMFTIKGAQIYVQTDQGPPPKRVPLLRRIQNVAVGAETLKHWLGEGGVPVSNDLAAQRASICAKCPQNIKGGLETWFTASASQFIRQQLETRRELKLSTPFDDELNVCNACTCPLQLKVHVPLPVITEHMTDATRKALDGACWILAEEKP